MNDTHKEKIDQEIKEYFGGDPYRAFIFYRTYSRYIDEKNRRETWEETVARYMKFMKEVLGKKLSDKDYFDIREAILRQEVMPSMRLLWVAGDAVRSNNASAFNCTFTGVDNLKRFREILFLLMSGCGVGFSVENKFIDKLPEVEHQTGNTLPVFVIPDSREGWADALHAGIMAWFDGNDISFDFSRVRPVGARLKRFGGRSSGPGPLKDLLSFVKTLILSSQGRQLRPIEVHDIVCKTAEIVVVGGTRRSALISLSDLYDAEMRDAKAGTFYEKHAQRAMSNNSVAYDVKPTQQEFMREWLALMESGTGERGLFNRDGAINVMPERRREGLDDYDQSAVGVNPCKPLNSLILTQNGYITFGQAIGNNKLKVVLPNGGTAKASMPFVTGRDRDVYRVRLSNGSYIYGTDNHKHKLYNGEWKEMSELRIGDYLEANIPKIFDSKVTNEKLYKDGLLAGWVHGDGSLSERKDGKGHILQMCFGDHELDVVPLFEDITGVKSNKHHQKPDTCKVIRTRKKNTINRLLDYEYNLKKEDLTWLYGKNKNYKLGFLQAVFTADGSVRKNNNVELYSTREDALQVIANILREFGIYSNVTIHNYAKSYIAKDGLQRNNANCYKINISGGQFKDIGFISKRKSELLENQGPRIKHRLKTFFDKVKVVDIDSSWSVEDVYDITVDDDCHSFIDTTVTTHNCSEIILRSRQMCNLTSVVCRPEDTEKTLMYKVRIATILGTYQSMLTNFEYLTKGWKDNCDEERLLGVSLNGQFDCPAIIGDDGSLLSKLKLHAVSTNEHYADKFKINKSTAITCTKPEGTGSQMLGVSSGIHPRYAPYYIRRVRIAVHDPLFALLRDFGVPCHPEVGQIKEAATTWVFEFPIRSPDGAITRKDISALDQLWTWKRVKENYAEHTISMTCYVGTDEWLRVGSWVWDNWDIVTGISFLPREDDQHVYELAPYEEITEEQYSILSSAMPDIDFSKLPEYEKEDMTQGAQELACSAGVCSVDDAPIKRGSD